MSGTSRGSQKPCDRCGMVVNHYPATGLPHPSHLASAACKAAFAARGKPKHKLSREGGAVRARWLRAQRRARGLCERCEAPSRFSRCPGCRAEHAAYEAARRAAKRKTD